MLTCFIFYNLFFVAHRLFLDGAAFDFNNDVLVDPKPKELFSQGPSIWIKPVESAVLQVREQRCNIVCEVGPHRQQNRRSFLFYLFFLGEHHDAMCCVVLLCVFLNCLAAAGGTATRRDTDVQLPDVQNQ